jgi:GTP cyclohydrolase I
MNRDNPQQDMDEFFAETQVYGFDEVKAVCGDGGMRANSNIHAACAAAPPGSLAEAFFGQGWGQEVHLRQVAEAVQHLMKTLYIDAPSDHNTRATALRVAKMYVTEVMKGRFLPQPDITAFPNALQLDELYTTGPITVRSMCSHHLVPIIGKAWIGIIPGEDSVIGLSKFNRLVDWVFSRPQIQEEATVQLADILMEKAKPKGLAVVVKATHLCMTWRGVRESDEAVMTTSVVRGALKESAAARAEFFSLIRER